MKTLQSQEFKKLQTKILFLNEQKTYRVKTISSTMDFARHKADNNEECVVWAETQTSGRGRLENKWISPEGGLWCSIVWAESSPEILNYLFFLVASCACEVLNLYGVKTKIKLPNDIYYKDKKIGGILIEKKGGFVILGLGINVNNRISHIQPEAISYYEITGKTVNIKEILVNILKTLQSYKERFSQEKDIFLKKWSEIL
ncbi:MAG: biotin--[acetyl-CoA-carboxylase] ligase [Candidatus Omnitrophica bacterium]|nr:biotin--[acetyl-CoA-carboxylase] ligase [Candidatus Omnitrophota bacterium]